MTRLLLVLILLISFVKTEEIFQRVKIYYEDYKQIQELIESPNLNIIKIFPQYLDVVVESTDLEEVEKAGFKFEVVIDDIAGYYKNILADREGGVFGNYYKYSEMRQAIIDLQSRFPNLVKVDSLSIRSIENRALYLIKISNSPGSNNGRPEVLISGAIHAYEPIGPSLCISDMTYLCEHYNPDPEIHWLVDYRQIYFIPVMNPDGYVYNETYPSMMWRKNRRPNSGGSYGVDLNRNYPYKWGYDNIGSSPNPPAWNYRGTAPASEPETQAIINFVNTHNIRTWHNHHSPNDVLLIPFGYIDSYPWNDTLVYFTMCREESLIYGFQKWGNSYRAYGYLVNGGVEDWAWCDSATYKIYCMVPELGMDYWEGLNDSSKIVNVCQRMLGAELYLIQAAGFFPKILNIAVNDSPPWGNNNGVLNPGERARLRITIKNKAVVDTAFGVIGNLSTTYPYLRITDSIGSYGNVVRLASVVNSGDPFAVACSSAAQPNEWVHFNLQFVWNSGNYQKTLPCSLKIGPVVMINEALRHPFENLNVEIVPNPARKNIHIRLSIENRTKDMVKRSIEPKAMAMGLKIYDVSGRLVTDFDLRSFAFHPSSLIAWNCLDDAGNQVKPGVYFVEVKFNNYSFVRKFVIIQ